MQKLTLSGIPLRVVGPNADGAFALTPTNGTDFAVIGAGVNWWDIFGAPALSVPGLDTSAVTDALLVTVVVTQLSGTSATITWEYWDGVSSTWNPIPSSPTTTISATGTTVFTLTPPYGNQVRPVLAFTAVTSLIGSIGVALK